jgi:hypothetical protein
MSLHVCKMLPYTQILHTIALDIYYHYYILFLHLQNI